MKASFALMFSMLSAAILLTLASCGQAEVAEYAVGSNEHSVAGRSSHDAGSVDSASHLRVSIIDVGKGDCILLQAGDSAVLIDTGYENTAADVLAHLKDQGVSSLDAMIITHYDRDHIDGIRTIGEAVGVGTVYLPGYEGSDKNYRSCVLAVKSLDVPSQEVTEEFSLRMGNARLAVFPSRVAYQPGTGKAEGNDNDMSLVATLTNGLDSYLFAGDLEEDGIAAYLAADHGTFDVLKMPHHGQRSSNTQEFLEGVRPQIAIITDAKKDPADKKTLKLLKSAGVKTYRTGTDGTIVIESDGDGTYAVASDN